MKVGIVGGGQLARMLALAGYPLGLCFKVLDPSPDACAGRVAELIEGGYDDPDALDRRAEWADVVTFDFENVPASAAERLAGRTAVYPPPPALAAAQDRLDEKTLFRRLGIPTPAFVPVAARAALDPATVVTGLPAVLKTRRLGYDGKGQVIVRDTGDIASAVDTLGGDNLIAEAWVPFDREVSAIGAPSVSGDVAVWPLTENVHVGGILDASRAPAPDADDLTPVATDYLGRLLARLDYAGVLALELFVCGEELLANEFAPRVHNSGHWTIEGSVTSQFENHLRAILDMPLGETSMRGFAGMLNIIGQIPEDRRALSAPPARLHDYGKSARPGRKLGHVTLVTGDPETRDRAMQSLSKSLKE